MLCLLEKTLFSAVFATSVAKAKKQALLFERAAKKHFSCLSSAQQHSTLSGLLQFCLKCQKITQIYRFELAQSLFLF